MIKGGSGELWKTLGVRGMALGLVVAVGCTGDTPSGDISPPDVSKITVFYPVDGLVRGRGVPGAFDGRQPNVRIAAHPSGTETITSVLPDGSFEFAIIAVSDDVLEISAAIDNKASARGDPAFIRVPPTPLPLPGFVCCQPANLCQAEADADLGLDCPTRIEGVTVDCANDNECKRLGEERLPIDPGLIQVSAPSPDGLIEVSGVLQPDAVITLVNRGQKGLGMGGGGSEAVKIADERGAFQFQGFRARGDDELVIQGRDLLGFRTPELSIIVPDAPLEGLDIIGAVPIETLEPPNVGKIAILMTPYGTDGLGICPDSGLNPRLCLSGGLTHQMVTNISAEVADVPKTPVPTATSAVVPNNRGILGDAFGGPQNIMIVLDMSDKANTPERDENGRRFDDVENYIRGLRSRDYVGLITFGATNQVVSELVDNSQRGNLINQLNALRDQAPEGESNIFAAVGQAAERLRADPSKRTGRIVVITTVDESGKQGLDGMGAPTGSTLEFDNALDAANPPNGESFTVDIMAVQVPDQVQNMDGSIDGNKELLRSLAGFTGGEFYDISSIEALTLRIADLMTRQFGAFILLYDLEIPCEADKASVLELTVDLKITGVEGDRTATATYRGPLSVAEPVEGACPGN